MNNERILANKMAKKLSTTDIENVSAAGTTHGTQIYTLAAGGNSDLEVDVTTDSL